MHMVWFGMVFSESMLLLLLLLLLLLPLLLTAAGGVVRWTDVQRVISHKSFAIIAL